MERYKLYLRPFTDDVKRSGIRGITGYRDGRYIILIDGELDDDQRETTLKHELSHILLGHFTGERNLVDIEREADEYAAAMTDDEFERLRGYAV